ncbi:MAG: hypothetical protein K9M19_01890 [Candidatus Marinimicrobia bacterium]|nr:hypothetical protein [Candidatus Neomarinimicrobiota bacterium]
MISEEQIFHQRNFANILDEAFRVRTEQLRSMVGIKSGRGRKKKLDRKIIKNQLKDLTIKIHFDKIKKTLDQYLDKKVTWNVEGWGAKNKIRYFKIWFDEQFKKQDNFVYIFWSDQDRPLYVGRTQNGRARPVKHFEKHWFPATKKIDIIPTLKSKVSQTECLAIHYFDPNWNSMKHGSKQKYSSDCFICKIHDKIDLEIEHTLNKR